MFSPSSCHFISFRPISSSTPCSPGRVRNMSLLHSVKTGSGANTTSYPVGTGRYFLGVKGSDRESDNSLPSTVEVKYGGVILPRPHMSS
jgi:hypothetical protein